MHPYSDMRDNKSDFPDLNTFYCCTFFVVLFFKECNAKTCKKYEFKMQMQLFFTTKFFEK